MPLLLKTNSTGSYSERMESTGELTPEYPGGLAELDLTLQRQIGFWRAAFQAAAR
jgi:hypothetical protein